jgi:hypothetical protein
MFTSFAEIAKAFLGGIITGVICELIAHGILRLRCLKNGSVPISDKISGIGLMRGIAIGVYFFVLVMLFNEKWAVKTTTTVIVMVASVFAIIGLELLYLLISRIYQRMTKPSEHIASAPGREVAYLIICLVMLMFVIDKLLPHFIAFECPREVGGKETIKGVVVKSDWQVRVLVHAISEECWHVQNTPGTDGKGHWQTECLFGGPGDEDFQILALASLDSLGMKLGDHVCPDQIPKNARRSEICLTRKRAEK